jgi:hypothetical protein
VSIQVCEAPVLASVAKNGKKRRISNVVDAISVSTTADASSRKFVSSENDYSTAADPEP